MAAEDTPWWRTYFDEDFRRIYAPLLPRHETLEEVESLIQLTGLEPGQRLLDLACGWGRHALELARAGVEVVGVDRSDHLLRQGLRAEDGEKVTWICGDLRHLPFRGSFDVVACLFSSIGYFDSVEDDVRVLHEVRRVLEDGGLFVLETVHRDSVVRDYVERDWWEGEDGEMVFVEREFDAVEGVSREHLRWVSGDGARGEKYHALRVRSASEWNAILAAAGFEGIGWYGGWDAEPFTYASDRLVLVATTKD